MWQLTKIAATNICAFRELEYSPLQGCTTLVFGNNLDNESQLSNGSGKSALIEAISLAITGEVLRRANTEEIINDSTNVATIRCTLTNIVSNDELVIIREFKRNSAQVISLFLNDAPIILSSINNYNKHILEIIGLDKDDIFSSFILSKHKYISFLQSSDRAKKELINRFSNGFMVDESIAALNTDMKVVEDDLHDAEKNVARCEGKLTAINDQIKIFNDKVAQRLSRKDELIGAHKEAIAKQRSKIREAKANMSALEKRIKELEEVEAWLQEKEGTQISVVEAYALIKDLFSKARLPHIRDYEYLSSDIKKSLDDCNRDIDAMVAQIKEQTKEVRDTANHYADLGAEYEKTVGFNTPKRAKFKEAIESAKDLRNKLIEENESFAEKVADLRAEIASTESMINGAVTCPKCKHVFSLQTDKPLSRLQAALKRLTKELEQTDKTYCQNKEKINAAGQTVSDTQNAMTELDNDEKTLLIRVNEAEIQTQSLRQNLCKKQAKLDTCKAKVEQITRQFAYLRQTMFDEAFDTLEAEFNHVDADIESCETITVSCQSNIVSYQEAIKELEDMNGNQTSEELTAQKSEAERELAEAVEDKREIEKIQSAMIEQEERFIAFKTYLANSKIEALAQITNEFLAAIGSDLKVKFTGFTVLKSGKMREKISITLLRDGIDCGSFGKFSAGEQCRVNLASILALNKLMNLNCGEGKGLDLLILDEILDVTDETGLANMFEALNSLHITTIAVSHGLVAESYPYRLTVTKQNGISTLNEYKA